MVVPLPITQPRSSPDSPSPQREKRAPYAVGELAQVQIQAGSTQHKLVCRRLVLALSSNAPKMQVVFVARDEFIRIARNAALPNPNTQESLWLEGSKTLVMNIGNQKISPKLELTASAFREAMGVIAERVALERGGSLLEAWSRRWQVLERKGSKSETPATLTLLDYIAERGKVEELLGCLRELSKRDPSAYDAVILNLIDEKLPSGATRCVPTSLDSSRIEQFVDSAAPSVTVPAVKLPLGQCLVGEEGKRIEVCTDLARAETDPRQQSTRLKEMILLQEYRDHIVRNSPWQDGLAEALQNQITVGTTPCWIEPRKLRVEHGDYTGGYVHFYVRIDLPMEQVIVRHHTRTYVSPTGTAVPTYRVRLKDTITNECFELVKPPVNCPLVGGALQSALGLVSKHGHLWIRCTGERNEGGILKLPPKVTLPDNTVLTGKALKDFAESLVHIAYVPAGMDLTTAVRKLSWEDL